MTSRTRTGLLETIRTRVRAAAADYPVLSRAADDLDACAPSALEAFRRMQDARPGLPGAQAYDAPTVSGGSAGLTQPERLADQQDRTEADRRLLDTTLNQLDVLTRSGLVTDSGEWCRNVTIRCLTLRRLVESWTPHRPTDKQRRAVAAANDGTWCEHHRSASIDEPAEHHGTVSGNLAIPMDLCGFCYWQVRRKGRLPSGEAMERRKRTGKNEKERV